MKLLRFLLPVLCIGVIFSSCQKELSLESGSATGTLKFESSGDCLPVLINGTYKKDTLLNATNYIDVQIDVLITGAYNIKTDTLNGYSFGASGAIATTGINTIRLFGSGRPIAGGVDVFTVNFAGTSCQINVVVTGTGGGGGTTADYTLGGSPGTCTGAVLNGTYMQGLATSASNTATINVNVTTPGTYTLTTPTVNGVTFTGSGAFASTGANTIVLTASGTPTAAATSAYPLTAGLSTCSFSITYTTAAGPAAYTLSCTTPTFSGTFQAGVSANGSTMTVGVNVTAGGTYSITSTTVNGVTFSGSGVLPATPAVQTVTLTAAGTPAAAGTFPYPLTSGGSTCTASVTFTAAPLPDFMTCNIDGAPTTFNFDDTAFYDNTITTGYTFLVAGGYFDSGATNSGFFLGIGNPSGVITTGTYTVNQGPGILVLAQYTTTTDVDYLAGSNPPTVQTNPFTITITFISSTRVEGTFQGPLLLDGTGPAVKNVTNGAFRLSFN